MDMLTIFCVLNANRLIYNERRIIMNSKEVLNTRDLTKIAVCVAIITICALISFPLPFTPAMITAQTMAINLAALILKPKQAFITVLVYILIGAVGVPVFSSGACGLEKLTGPTGGFILGFLIMAPVISYLKGKGNDVRRYLAVTIIIGMPLLYAFGTAQMCLVLNIGVYKALSMAVIPFIFGDVLKCIAASLLGNRLNKISFIRQTAV